MSTQKWLLGFLIKADIWGKSEAAVKKIISGQKWDESRGPSPGKYHGLKVNAKNSCSS